MKNLLKNKNQVIYLSVSASLLTLSLKFSAYYLTNSVGLLGDAAESVVNLAAAIMAAILLNYASRPADSRHAYGHDKAEYFSSGLEGGLILIAAVGIGYTATQRILHPQPIENLNIGLMISLGAAGVNFIAARFILIAAHNYDSITLEADAKHLLTDVWTSIGVIAGLVTAQVTGLFIIDPIIAFLVATNIVLSGIDIIKRSFRGLMDFSLPDNEIRVIEKIIKEYSEEDIHYHNLRTRKSGPNRFIEFHILLTGTTSVQTAHDLCEAIEDEIKRELKNTQVTIHVEPIEDRTSWDVVKGIDN